MRFSYPAIDNVFDTDDARVNALVIENRSLFCEILRDIYSQTEGLDGKAVLSGNGKIIEFSKCADITSNYIPFDLNRKPLISKILTALENQSRKAEFYEKTMKLLADIENYIDALAVDFSCDMDYNKISILSVLKSVGLEVHDDSTCIAEKMLNYMELVREFDSDKLFIAVNMRGYVDDASMDSFLKTVLSHKYHFLMLESTSYPLLCYEKRYTVDEDLCEF